jgi:hypothetical protein
MSSRCRAIITRSYRSLRDIEAAVLVIEGEVGAVLRVVILNLVAWYRQDAGSLGCGAAHDQSA